MPADYKHCIARVSNSVSPWQSQADAAATFPILQLIDSTRAPICRQNSEYTLLGQGGAIASCHSLDYISFGKKSRQANFGDQ
jgi:hypothetical protein